MIHHRPFSPLGLIAILRSEDKKQAYAAYIGDAIWRIMMWMHPKTEIPSFSRYMKEIDNPVREKSGREIVNDLIQKLKQRKGGEAK